MKKEITLKLNEQYSFDLETHEGGGYSWTIVSNNETVTEVSLTPRLLEFDTEHLPIGKSAPVEVIIKAISKGSSKIVLEERREWEKKTKPLNSCKLNITVK